jgi:hypothetical protein
MVLMQLVQRLADSATGRYYLRRVLVLVLALAGVGSLVVLYLRAGRSTVRVR